MSREQGSAREVWDGVRPCSRRLRDGPGRRQGASLQARALTSCSSVSASALRSHGAAALAAGSAHCTVHLFLPAQPARPYPHRTASAAVQADGAGESPQPLHHAPQGHGFVQLVTHVVVPLGWGRGSAVCMAPWHWQGPSREPQHAPARQISAAAPAHELSLPRARGASTRCASTHLSQRSCISLCSLVS